MEESMPKSIGTIQPLVLVRTASALLFSVLRGVVYDSDASFEDVRSRVCSSAAYDRLAGDSLAIPLSYLEVIQDCMQVFSKLVDGKRLYFVDLQIFRSGQIHTNIVPYEPWLPISRPVPVQQLTLTGLFLISFPREPVPRVVVH